MGCRSICHECRRSDRPSARSRIVAVSSLVSLLFLVPLPCLAQPSCAPLPPPSGDTIELFPADVDSLASVVGGAASGTTILLHDGTYDLRETVYFPNPGVTLRSLSGDRDAVIIDGAYDLGAGELLGVYASDVTIADLTLSRAYYHPIHVWDPGVIITGILMHNLRIVDPGEQAIKVNPAGAGFVDHSTIECCSIELTDVGRTQIRNSCYTGGIDVHRAQGWVVRRNYVEGFWCDTGLSEHGIHFWKASRDTLVEQNVIVDCARGIGFGLGSSGDDRVYPDDPYPGVGYMGHIDGVIRNNFVVATDPGLFSSPDGFDTGVGLEQSRGTEVVHNSVFSSSAPLSSSMEWRFVNTLTHVANNLVSHSLLTRDGASAALEGNIESAPSSWFENPAGGDLHLTANASSAVDAGVSLAAGLCDDDIDIDLRDASPDVGGDEVGGLIFADGFESGDALSWSRTVG